ncbi:hypothetical protein [Paractinoplanes toevensis]|uniref:TetR family transcriptional regulator n=1 Tax=Paractinoplanes toevensis TaxID=571911 RepID=A0A919TCF8_9ACTN|nr:hypothetical protein [Actinoplanes toevensis]GIM93444.1 hypothetical protein Ato02nite_052370 [Actinoplanes toevensis]
MRASWPAARDMDPATLTMQAVAERLGVDRKALNYHVTDRDGLLELVAQETLSSLLGERPAAGRRPLAGHGAGDRPPDPGLD